jgi:hypothetical protein
MAILTHKLMCTNAQKKSQHCVGLYDTLEIANDAKERHEVCFPRCKFEVIANN